MTYILIQYNLIVLSHIMSVLYISTSFYLNSFILAIRYLYKITKSNLWILGITVDKLNLLHMDGTNL